MPRISVITPTHDPRWLSEAWASLQRQTFADWEWVLVPNGRALAEEPGLIFEINKDPRVRIVPCLEATQSVGAIKRFAFGHGTGDILVELDHDDHLADTALEKVERAMTVDVDFVYSDCADYSPTGAPVVYHNPNARAAWEAEGWRFAETTVDGKSWLHPRSWQPSAQALSVIMYAPNHLRAWKREFYHGIGGHDAALSVCDDHELLIRTYLAGRMRHIDELLYFYRITGDNTWLQRQDLIRQKTYELRERYLHALVARECVLDGVPCYDLGGALGEAPGAPWQSVDQGPNADVTCDLTQRWPFEDGSVGAFRAVDIFEHLPDKLHTMSEIYRCLRPGGWLISYTPSAMGPGAYQDPTHCSYWVENSFRYYTDRNLARYIRNDTERFLEVRLFETQGAIPYVVADLISLKNDDGRLPGRRRI